jgi:hypothetical protein
MNLKGSIKNLGKGLLNLPGWHTNRKIVVFESDDWGSIRMPSKKIYNYCLKKGYQVDKSPYTKYDSLASNEDLERLFEILMAHSDKNNKQPVITANVLVANPDFERIRQSDFYLYYPESIAETFNSYPAHSKCLEYWKEGHEKGFFHLQSHGREHLNVSRFMKDLRDGVEEALFAFETKMPGIFPKRSSNGGNFYVVSNEFKNESDKIEKCKILVEGLMRFKNIFGLKSSSFISSNYVWQDDFEHSMSINGVKYIQGSYFQLLPKGDYKGFKKKIHFLGQKNHYGQYYLIRNALFEPSLKKNVDWVNRCLNEINTAFNFKKPAIISTHRINYVGYIDQKNVDNNLKLFDQLLTEIVKRWPDVEYMSTTDIGRIIEESRL